MTTKAKQKAWRILHHQPGVRWERDRDEIKVAMQIAKGQCQVHPTKYRCTNVATVVVKEANNNLVACCETCRLIGFGPTPAEKAASTKAQNAKQAGLPGVATATAKPQYK